MADDSAAEPATDGEGEGEDGADDSAAASAAEDGDDGSAGGGDGDDNGGGAAAAAPGSSGRAASGGVMVPHTVDPNRVKMLSAGYRREMEQRIRREYETKLRRNALFSKKQKVAEQKRKSATEARVRKDVEERFKLRGEMKALQAQVKKATEDMEGKIKEAQDDLRKELLDKHQEGKDALDAHKDKNGHRNKLAKYGYTISSITDANTTGNSLVTHDSQ